MSRRVSSLDRTTVGIERNINSEYDNVKIVANDIDSVITTASNIDSVNTVAGISGDVAAIAADIAGVGIAVANIVDIQNAEENAVKSKNWANYPEDVLVPEGNQVDEYSSYHYERKSSDSATSAAANAVATGEDRIQTGLDKVATGEDRVQTGLDKVATAADRVQTGLDRNAIGDTVTATAADRVQTGLDATATSLDAAATAANLVQTGVDKTQTGLDRVATGEDRVQTGLDRIQTEADRTQTGLDAIATAADRVATGNDVVASAADRVQTGLDRVQTGADRTAAEAARDATVAVYEEGTSLTPAPSKIPIGRASDGKLPVAFHPLAEMRTPPIMSTFNGFPPVDATYTGGGKVVADKDGILRKTGTDVPAVEGGYWDGNKFVDEDPNEVPVTTRTFMQTQKGESVVHLDPDWRGYLGEGSRTNLLLWSETFDTLAAWSRGFGTTLISTNTVVAPNGETTADVLDIGTGGLYQTMANLDGLYTPSIWIKAEAPLQIKLGSRSFASNSDITVNVTTDWQRFSAPLDSGGDLYLTLRSVTGTVRVHLWGAQLEQAPFASSYIKTEATTVTRPADVLSIPTAGRIREQNWGKRFRVVPEATAQTGYIWSTYTDANNEMSVYAEPTQITFRKRTAGIETNCTITHTLTAVPTMIDIRQDSTNGMGIRVSTDEGVTWSPWTEVTTATAKADGAVATTMQYGSRNSTGHYFGNYSHSRSLFNTDPKTPMEEQ